MSIVPASGWEDLRDTLSREPGVIILLGAMDTGKSTLARYLATELTSLSAVSVVDADVGQSELCLPGTVGLGIFPVRTKNCLDYRCTTFSFLGSASPSKIILRLVQTTRRFVEAGTREASFVLVDTTGLIKGEFGIGLKLAKIRVIRPTHVVVIQREDECEPILSHLDNVAIHRLPPSPLIQPRNAEIRSQARQDKLAAFFETAEFEHLVPVRKIELLRYGHPTTLTHEEIAPGTVFGLIHDEETLGLGVATEADKRSITLRTALGSLKGINRLLYGDIILSPEP